jgi:prephenate dehydratase
MIKVAIQGGKASFHEMAAIQFFSEEIDVEYCMTFQEIFEKITNKTIHYGVVAIENTIAGSLLPNYALLEENKHKIVGETNLHIHQNLMSLPGTKIEDIKEVYSHPIAIQQSKVFFNDYRYMKLIEAEDTALSAKMIREEMLENTAAIASIRASEIYDLEVLATNIETHKRNFTRFLIITNEEEAEKVTYKPDKATLCFTLPDEAGSLSSILAILAFYKISLTKIQSLPIIGKEFEYFFHVDVIFDNYARYKQAITAVKPLMRDFQILGEYKQALRN